MAEWMDAAVLRSYAGDFVAPRAFQVVWAEGADAEGVSGSRGEIAGGGGAATGNFGLRSGGGVWVGAHLDDVGLGLGDGVAGDVEFAGVVAHGGGEVGGLVHAGGGGGIGLDFKGGVEDLGNRHRMQYRCRCRGR